MHGARTRVIKEKEDKANESEGIAALLAIANERARDRAFELSAGGRRRASPRRGDDSR